MRNLTTRRLLMSLALSAVLVTVANLATAQTSAPAEDRAPVVTTPAQAQPSQTAQPAQPAGPTTQAPNAAPTTGPADGQQKNNSWIFMLVAAAFFVLIIWSSRKPKKEEQRRREMLANLKKGDKVTTIGGIVGTIIETRDDELVVKVDENSNTRMHFARWAIRQVGEPKADEEKK